MASRSVAAACQSISVIPPTYQSEGRWYADLRGRILSVAQKRCRARSALHTFIKRTSGVTDRPLEFLVFVLTKRILHSADGVLDLAFDLVHLAFGLQLGIAGDLADGILHGAFGLI